MMMHSLRILSWTVYYGQQAYKKSVLPLDSFFRGRRFYGADTGRRDRAAKEGSSDGAPGDGFGIDLKRQGAELVGRCPFHDDHTPSLVVSPKTNLWHCMGACNIGGSTIDWVMKTRGVSFRHAVELLRADHPSLAAGNGHVVRKGTTAKLPSPVALDADEQQTLRDVVSFYHETLKESPEALRYLETRGLTHPEMMERFQLGFANRKLGLTLPDKNRKEGAELRGRSQRLGILRESGHEHFNGSLIIPVFDLEGNVLGMYGRKITPGLREGTPLHMYLPGPHRGVWNEEALQTDRNRAGQLRYPIHLQGRHHQADQRHA